MKALLMHPDRDFDLRQALPRHEPALRQDLELDTLLRAMAGDDEFVSEVAHKALVGGQGNDVETILYRQEIVSDSLEHPEVIRELYGLAWQAIEGKRASHWSFSGDFPSSTLYGAIIVLQMFMEILKKLRAIADAQAGGFESRGLAALFAMLRREFSDQYFAEIEAHLVELRYDKGVLLSAGLGEGNEGVDYMLRQSRGKNPGLLGRLLGKGPQAYTVRISDRDHAGAKTLSTMRNRGINPVANALAQSMDHILGFFEMLRTELAFYVGCLNLHDRLSQLGAPTCLPQPTAAGAGDFRFDALYDPCLALGMQRQPVGNDLVADRRNLVVITGANQGGKSSFLRGIGLAQLMMQSGMFVAAGSFVAELRTGLFTHYKREEDASMASGKFDEELGRMSTIVDDIGPGSMLLFNESFASTNEREGSEVARQITAALLEKGIKVFFVTHLYAFAHECFERGTANAITLRAERRADGTRTFKLREGEPLETSYGEDLYREVFAEESAVGSRVGQAVP